MQALEYPGCQFETLFGHFASTGRALWNPAFAKFNTYRPASGSQVCLPLAGSYK